MAIRRPSVRRETRRNGSVAAHADHEFRVFAAKDAASGRDGFDGGDDGAQLAGRGLAGPRTGANQFDAFSAGRREARFEAEIAADEDAVATEFIPVGRKNFERRENVPRGAASRYGHAPFF